MPDDLTNLTRAELRERLAQAEAEIERLRQELARLADPTFGREPADWPPAEYRERAR